MSYVAPSAKTVGWSMEEAAAAVGLLSSSGVKASKAGSSLRASLSRISAPSKEVQKKYGGIIEKMFDSEDSMKSLSQVVGVLEDEMQGMSDKSRQAALSTIFGQEAMNAWNILLERGSGKVQDYTKELGNADGTAKQMADTMNSGIVGAIRQLGSQLQEAAIAVGSVFEPAVLAVTDKLKSAIKWFNGLSDQSKRTAAVVAGVGTAFALVGGPLLMLLGFLPNIIGGFKAVWGIIKKVRYVFLAITSPIGLAIAAIVAIVGAVVYAYKKFDWFRNFVHSVWERIKQIFKAALEFLKPYVLKAMDAIKSFFKEKLDQILKFWKDNGDMILQAAKNVWGVIKNVVTTVADTIWKAMKFVWPLVESLIKSTWNAIKNTISGAIDIILGIIKTFAGLFTGNFGKMWEGIKQIVMGAVKAVWGIINLIFISKIFGAIKSFALAARGLFANFWTIVKGLWTSGTTAVKNVFTTVFNWIKNFANNTMKTTWNLLKTVWNGIKKTVTTVFNAIKSFLKNGLTWAKNTFKSTWEGIKTVTSTVFNAIKSVISTVWNTIKGVFTTVLDVIKNVLKGRFGAAKEIVKSAMTKVKDSVMSLWQKAEDFLKKVSLYDVGKNIIEGLKNGIKSMASSVMNRVKSIADGIKDKVTGILDIHSPSRVMMDVGVNTGRGLVKGLENITPKVGVASEDMAKETAFSPRKQQDIPQKSSGGGRNQGGGVTIHINGDVYDEIHFQRLVQRIDEEMGRSVGGAYS